MSNKRTKIGKFVHNKWTAINIRAGKYKDKQPEKTKQKSKVYQNVQILFTREEFKNWCYERLAEIESLNRPSINRIDSKKDYSLDNIEIIELTKNIQNKKHNNRYINGKKSNTIRGIRCIDKKWRARITINQKEIHLGTFRTKELALEAFKTTYFNYYGKYPF